MIRTRRLPLIALTLVLALGAYVRLAHLGRAEFDQDDLDMYFAAASVAAGHGPVLPSGMQYTRGSDITRMAAVSGRFVTDPEAAARLPSAIFGVAGLFIFAGIAWAWFGPWPAVFAVALLAMDPELVFQSRSVRFYTYQCVYGLVALFAGWQVVRRMGSAETPSNKEFYREWGWAAVTVAAFVLATRVQVTTLSVFAGWGLVLIVAAALDVRARGVRACSRSVPAQLTMLGAALLLVALAVIAVMGAPVALRNAYQTIRQVPTWAGGVPGSPLAYYYSLADTFPVVLALAPALFIIVALKRWRLALFLAIWFGVPLALHSFVLAWKADRYVLLAMPPLFLAAGAVAAEGCATLHRAIVRAVSAWRTDTKVQRPSGSMPRLIASVVVVIVAAFALVTRPAFARARDSLDEKLPGYQPGWRASGAVLRRVDPSGAMPVGSTSPLASLRYWGRDDFTVQRGLMDNALRAPPTATLARAGDGGPRDYYGGVPILLTAQSIRERFTTAPAVIVGLDSLSVKFNNVDSSLVRVLQDSAVELCRGRCGGMRLYRLQLRAPRE